MSVNCAKLTLLVLLGATVASCRPLNFISEAMRQTHNSITDQLKLTQPVVGSSPLFSSIIRNVSNSINCQEKVTLINATLEVYSKIFSSLLKHSHHSHHDKSLVDMVPTENRTQLREDLRKLERKMDNLKTHLSHAQQNKEDLLGMLQEIQVDDPLVQRKALAEFLRVYQAASGVLYWDNAH